MHLVREFLNNFYIYLSDIIPYFIFAVFITSIFHALTRLSWLKIILKREKMAPLYTGLTGSILPFCSCSMLPILNLINNMSKNYAPTLSFLILSPVISPVSTILTYGYFGLSITIFRIIGAMLFTMLFAYMSVFFFKKPRGLPTVIGEERKNNGWKNFFNYFKENFIDIGRYILLGIFIASFIKTLLPLNHLISYISGGIISYLLLALISIPTYVCSGEEIPIAKSLVDTGFTSGDALTFMLASTGICLPTLIASIKFLPKGLIISYAILWLFFCVGLGFLYDKIF